MLKSNKLTGIALTAAFFFLVPTIGAADKRDLDPKRLAALAESAESAEDLQQVARLYEQRAEMLDEKALRHVRLEQRYAAAPKSLIAKRSHGWNTPARQRQLAASARNEAETARELSRVHLAKADSRAAEVD